MVLHRILTAGGSQEAAKEAASCELASRACKQENSAQPSVQVEDQQQALRSTSRDAEGDFEDTAASIQWVDK